MSLPDLLMGARSDTSAVVIETYRFRLFNGFWTSKGSCLLFFRFVFVSRVCFVEEDVVDKVIVFQEDLKEKETVG